MLICQLTDLHIRSSDSGDSLAVDTLRLSERAFRAVAALDPAPIAVLVTGDIGDCGMEGEYALFLQLVSRHISAPVLVVPGNHDRRDAFRKQLGLLPGVTSGREFIHYVVDDFPVRLVMLDTVVPNAAHGELCPDRLRFLDQVLSEEPHKPTLIAMHHPPFVCGIDHMDSMNLRNASAFAAVVAKHAQVERIVCGHVHRPVTARVAQAVASIGPSIAHAVELALRPDAPGAFVLEPPAFHVHRWSAQDGFVSHLAYVKDFPGPFTFADQPQRPCD